MKNFLKNYWTWCVGILFSASAILFFCCFPRTIYEKAAFWSHLLLLIPLVIYSIMFPKVVFKAEDSQKYFLAYSVCWLAIAIIVHYLMWADYIFAVALFAAFVLCSCDDISSIWFLIPLLTFLLVINRYAKEMHDSLPIQTDVVSGIYDRSKGYASSIIDLEQSGPYEIETDEANRVNVGDTVRIRICNNKLEIVHD